MKQIILLIFIFLPSLGFSENTLNDTTTYYLGGKGVLVGDNRENAVIISSEVINNLTYSLLTKYDTRTSQKIWVKEICRVEGHGTPKQVQSTQDGGFILTSREYVKATNTTNDLLVKADAEGNILWRTNLKDYNINFPNKEFLIAETANGEFIFSGPNLLFKTNFEGEVIWQKHTSNVNIISVKATEDGNIILVGDIKLDSSIYPDMLILKVDSEGNEIWRKVYDYNGGKDIANAVVELENGDFLVVGRVENIQTEQSTGFIARIDSNSEILWLKTNSSMSWGTILEKATTPGKFYFVNNDTLLTLNENGAILENYYVGGISTEVAKIYSGITGITVVGFRYGWILRIHTINLGNDGSFCDAKLTITSNKSLDIFYGEQVTLDAGEGFTSYRWSTGDTTRTITVSEAGNYHVTVVNGVGCTYTTEPITVTTTCKATTSITADKSTTITGGEVITLDAGEGFTTYRWNTGATTRTITVSDAGEYYVEVTDKYGCYFTTDAVTITVNCHTTTSISANKPLDIQPGEKIILDAGPGFATYQWSTGETTRTIEVSQAGSYRVEVSYEYGCPFVSDWVNVTVSCKASTTITADKPLTINAGEAVTLDAGEGFAGYKWSTGETTRYITVNQAGQYYVEVTNEFGCSYKSDPVTLALICNIKANIVANKPLNICPGETVTLDAGEGFTAYKWSTGDTTRTISVSGAGYFTVEVKNEYNCSFTTDPVQVIVDNPYAGDQICYVTVDEETGKHRISWNKTPDKNTSAYNIYKYVVGGITKVATVSFEESPSIIDENSQPESRSETYFIRAVNNCGSESSVGTSHKTVLLQASLGTSGEVNLTWNRYIGATALKTIIYRGSDLKNMKPIAELTGHEDRYIDRNPNTNESIYRVGIELNTICGSGTPGGRISSPEASVIALSNSLSLRVNGLSDNYETGSKLLSIHPNPIEADATITVDQNQAQPVLLQVLNGVGQIVRDQKVFDHTILFKRKGLPAGFYIVAVSLKNGKTLKKKIILN